MKRSVRELEAEIERLRTENARLQAELNALYDKLKAIMR